MLKKLLTGGLFESIEGIATEWIETNVEKAEAQAILMKAMDPNGRMRRVVTQFTCLAYGWYLVFTTVLILMTAWGVGGEVCTTLETVTNCELAAERAAALMTSLFLPITTAFGTIVTASFGVNGVNSFKGDKN